MDKQVKKREWVKTAAIIFLAVLLALTFFSNTIMNRTLPEVSTAQVTDGNISAKVRGTGIVSAIGNTDIKSPATTTIASVKVKSGQEVNSGDVLFILGEQSDELTAAEEELSSLQFQLQRYKNSYPTDAEGSKLSVAEANYNNALANEQRAYDAYQASISGLDEQIAKCHELLIAAQNKYNTRATTITNMALLRKWSKDEPEIMLRKPSKH